MSPSITGEAGPNSRSQPSEGSSDSSMPPVPKISSEARPDTVSSAVSNPCTELALVNWMPMTTAMPSPIPTIVVHVRMRSCIIRRTMNWRNRRLIR